MQMLSDGAERRKFERIKKRSILRVNRKIALLEDISQEGLLVSIENVPRSRELTIVLNIFGSEFELTGKIRWRSEKDDFSGLYSLGIMVINPPEKFKNMVKQVKKERG